MAAAVDFNGDGQADILWRDSTTGDLCIWLMNGGTYSSGVWLGNVPVQWQIVAVTDFNNDGDLDILWRNTSTGECSIWLMNGASFGSGVSLGIVPTQWQTVK
jgi:hypothetical protein